MFHKIKSTRFLVGDSQVPEDIVGMLSKWSTVQQLHCVSNN